MAEKVTHVRLSQVPLRRAAIMQTLITRLICQPVSDDRDDFTQWVIGEGNLEDAPSDLSNVHAVVGDFITKKNGWILGGTVGLIFRIDDEDEPATIVPNWVVDTYAEWANDTLWDFLSANLRTLMHLCVGASLAIDLPLEPPTMTVQRIQDEDETSTTSDVAAKDNPKG